MGFRAASSIAVIALILSGHLVFVATPAPATGATYTVSKQRLTLSGNPISAALDYANHDLYIATQNGYILVFSPAAGHIIANISIPLSNGRIAYDNQTGFLYVSNGSAIVAINGATNSVGSVILTPNFFSYTFTYGAGLIYVAGAT